MRFYLSVLKKYVVFTGRARRKEYWMFALINALIILGLNIFGLLLGIGEPRNGSPLVALYELAVLIPAISVGVRRMHDTGHSGFWLLVPIANFLLLIEEGQRAENQYGADPKAVSQAVPAVLAA